MPFPGTPLQVPDFNKQEVEGIAVDAVKKEIASGNIPTGSKLYRHVLDRIDTSIDNQRIVIISSSLEITPNSFVSGYLDAISGSPTGYALADKPIKYIQNVEDGYLYLRFYIIRNENFSSDENRWLLSAFTDTVTEL